MAVTKIQVTARITGSVLFDHEAEGNTIRLTLEAAVSARANLARADLAGANLAGANLDGAYLARANLAGANLDGAYLARANLAGAYLDGAYLAGANLAGANLAGANLARANLAGAYLDGACLDGDEKLVGERPILQIGPIGSRCAHFVAYLTDKGLRLRAGCFFGSRKQFEQKLAATHDDNSHAQEYRAALALIDAHAAAWAPAEVAESVAEVAAEE